MVKSNFKKTNALSLSWVLYTTHHCISDVSSSVVFSSFSFFFVMFSFFCFLGLTLVLFFGVILKKDLYRPLLHSSTSGRVMTVMQALHMYQVIIGVSDVSLSSLSLSYLLSPFISSLTHTQQSSAWTPPPLVAGTWQ